MTSSLKVEAKAGIRIWLPLMQSWLADALLRNKDPAALMAVATEGVEISGQTSARCHDAELHGLCSVEVVLLELRLVDAIGDLVGNRMRQRADRAGPLCVEVGADRVLPVDHDRRRSICDAVLDVGRLAPGAHADQHTLGRVSMAPFIDLDRERVDALGCRGRRLRDDVERLAE